MKDSHGPESLDRRVEEIRRLMREHRTPVDPGPYFVDRVIARLPRTEGPMLAWAARRVLPVMLVLAAVLSVAVLVTDGSSKRPAEAASASSTSQRAHDPLEWLLDDGQGVR